MNDTRYGASGRPYTRWWWFADRIQEEDIDRQLDWVSTVGFGGVEVAFVYPYDESDTADAFLGDRFRDLVAHTAVSCRQRDLGFDVTFGTLWPFGGSMVAESDASRTWNGLSEQRLRRSWESAEGKEPGFILNHLDRTALKRYADDLGAALQPAVDRYRSQDTAAGTPCFFLDSWEVHTEGLWTDGFGEAFERRFGYRIEPFLEALDDTPDVLHDYRKLIGEYALEEFYRPYTTLCNARGALARVQCHGAPTDLIAAYSVADVPESEAILFDAGFSQIAASAAAQSGARVVSAEAFTCLYGWERWPGPGQHQGEEKWEDIRLLGDALLANGVNLLVWHGMPFQRGDRPQAFYASVHVGPDSAFAAELPRLNAYFSRVSRLMQEGSSYSRLAVYVPLEDTLRQGELPDELKRPSAKYPWEMHYLHFPEETCGFRPFWTSACMLRDAVVVPQGVRLGQITVPALYCDAAYLDAETLGAMLRLARDGAPIVVTRVPAYPGHAEPDDYQSLREQLLSLAHKDLTELRKPAGGGEAVLQPLISARDLPEYWVRRVQNAEQDILRFWFAHPASREIHYPVPYDYASTAQPCAMDVQVFAYNQTLPIKLEFRQNSGILLEVSASGIHRVLHGEDLFSRAV